VTERLFITIRGHSIAMNHRMKVCSKENALPQWQGVLILMPAIT